MSIFIMNMLTSGLPDTSLLKEHLVKSSPHLRLFIMGLVLLVTLRFRPKGILPEKIRHAWYLKKPDIIIYSVGFIVI